MPDHSTSPTSWAAHLRPRLAGLRLSPAREAEIIEELSLHLDARYEELIAAGVNQDEARRLALEELREPETLAHSMRPLRQSNVPPPVTPGVWRRFPVAAPLVHFLVQPGLRVRPVPICSPNRDVQRGRSLVDGQAGEVAEIDHLRQ